jgi:ketosteroid isomerase-like protein
MSKRLRQQLEVVMRMAACIAAVVAVVGVASGQTRKTDQVLERIRNDFAAAFNAKDAGRVASFYADDATLMPPNQPLVTGRSNIEASYRTAFGQNIGSIALQSIESATGGQWGFQAGTWKLSMGSAGNVGGAVIVTESPRVTVGKNIVIYKRVGSDWKMAYDIWNDDALASAK